MSLSSLLRIAPSFTPTSIPGLSLWIDGADTSLISTPKRFAPTDLSDCLVWFDAANRESISTTDQITPIAQWSNLGTLSTVMEGLTGTGISGVSKINGKNVVTFPSGSNMRWFGSIPTQEKTAFAVFKTNTDLTTEPMPYVNLVNGEAAQAFQYGMVYAGGDFIYTGCVNGIWCIAALPGPDPYNNPVIFNTRWDIDQRNNIMWANGHPLDIVENHDAGLFETAPIYYTMGRTDGTTIDVGELIIFSRSLSDAEFYTVTNYLQEKWNVGSYQAFSTTVEAIYDKSPYNLPITISETRPLFSTNTLNGRPGLVFLGNEFLRGTFSSIWGLSTFTTFAVASMNNLARTNARLLSFSRVGSNDSINPLFVAPFTRAAGSNAIASLRNSTYISPITISTNSTFLLTAEYTNLSSFMYVFGNRPSTTSVSTLGNFGFGNFGIGFLADTGGLAEDAYWSGSIGEILVYLSSISQADRQLVEGYLAWKWGGAPGLSTAHPYSAQRVLPPPPQRTIFLSNFRPNTLCNCALWLDASDPYGTQKSPAPATPISNWVSKGTQYISLQNISNSAPTYNSKGILGQPSLDFDGTTGYTSLAFFETLSTYTLFLVGNTSNAEANINAGFMSLLADPDYEALASPNGLGLMGADPPNNTWFTFMHNSTISSNGFQVSVGDTRGETPAGIYATSISSLTQTFFYNASTFSTFVFTSSPGAANSLTIGYLGQSSKITNTLQGSIGEIILYSPALNLNERQIVEGYLATKYRLKSSLPHDHPYLNLPYTTSLPATTGTRFQPYSDTFSPLSISSCTLWLDGRDTTTLLLTSTQQVNYWKDKSPSSNDMAEGNYYNFGLPSLGPNYLFDPEYQTTGLFFSTGITSYLVPTNLASFPITDSNYTIFAVAKYTDSTLSSPQTLFQNVDDNGQGFRWLRLQSSFLQNFSTTDINLTSTTTITQTSGVFTAHVLNNVSTLVTGNIVSRGTRTSQVANNTNFYIGSYSNLANTGFTGYLYELLVYNAGLSTLERQQVESYLSMKWNLDQFLPAAHLNFSTPAGRWTNGIVPFSRTLGYLGRQIPIPFTYTGVLQSTVLPAGTTSIGVSLWGSGGQTTTSGGGGYVSGTWAVSTGISTIYVVVGSAASGSKPIIQGGGGSGASGGVAGGGFSGLFWHPIPNQSTCIAIAGGGGGNGTWVSGSFGGWPSGGNASGGNGANGTGGTQTTPGLPGQWSGGNANGGGSTLKGGDSSTAQAGGGGGGGGWYGGGSGYGPQSIGYGGGGGGGSSFLGRLAGSLFSNGTLGGTGGGQGAPFVVGTPGMGGCNGLAVITTPRFK